MDLLRPPPDVRPSIGEWPDGMQWLEMGRQMVETQGLEMFRLVGEFSACRMLGLHLGAPLGVDARVDAAWAAFHENCNHPDWGPACIAHVLDDMADVDARRRQVLRRVEDRLELVAEEAEAARGEGGEGRDEGRGALGRARRRQHQ